MHGYVIARVLIFTEQLLEEIKLSVKDKQEDIQNAITGAVSDRIGAIESVHESIHRDKTTLENLRNQLEDRISQLEFRENEVKQKEEQMLDQKEKFDQETTEEKEEICRQWQLLRDEITRMEETHEVQKVIIPTLRNHFATQYLKCTSGSKGG